MSQRGTTLVVLAIVTLGAVAAGCTSEKTGAATAATTTPAPSPTPTTVSIGTQKLTILVPAHYQLTPASRASSDGKCDIHGVSLSDLSKNIVATIAMPPDTCPNHGEPAINGNYGVFINRQDLANQTNVQQRNVPAGSVASFTETYTECTNSCKHLGIDVAVLFLAHPTDPHHAAINIFDTDDSSKSDNGFVPADFAAGIKVN